jgi:hypothetical protein
VLPWSLIHNSFVSVGNGIAASANNEAIVGACDRLGFTFDDFIEFQLRSNLFVELGNSKFGDLDHMWIIEVFDSARSTIQNFLPRTYKGHENS